MKQYIRSDEIRYTNPNGKQRVVPVDNYDFRYLIKEIEEVMGYEFASQVEELLYDHETDMNYQNEDVIDIIQSYTGSISDEKEDAVSALYNLLDIVNEWNAVASGEDKAKLDKMYDLIVDDIEPALSEIEGDVYDMRDQLNIK